MRIAVVGVGSIGGVILGALADTNAELVAVSRGDSAISLRLGLTVISPEGAMEMIPSERYWVVDTISESVPASLIGSCDVSIICGKASDTPILSSVCEDLLSPSGIAFSVQNGLGHAETLGSRVGNSRVLGGSTTHSAWKDADGAVNWSGRGSIDLGSFDGSRPSEIAEMLIDTLEDACLNPRWSSEIQNVIWKKLLINVAINPVCAIAGVRNGAITEIPELWNQSIGSMKEAEEVAINSGATLAEGDCEEYLRKVVAATSENRVSMLQDLMAGRKTEIDFLCGVVVERGRALGIPTPRNEMLHALVKGIEVSQHIN